MDLRIVNYGDWSEGNIQGSGCSSFQMDLCMQAGGKLDASMRKAYCLILRVQYPCEGLLAVLDSACGGIYIEMSGRRVSAGVWDA